MTAAVDVLDFAEFLESQPPNSRGRSEKIIGPRRNFSGRWLSLPELRLHCPSEKCRGTRLFHCGNEPQVSEAYTNVFLQYVCRNCKGSLRTYALMIREVDGAVLEVIKVGEHPPFGPPVPSKVISLIGPDRDTFISGRRAENLGLGIGAFAYYRRVIENQWTRIVDEVIRVSETVGAEPAVIETLRRARTETQFAKAIDMIRDAVPESLKISGHNPLKLLHRALSEGLHANTDEACLELASSVRVVMTELAERIGQALKDEKELQDAVTRLMHRKAESREPA